MWCRTNVEKECVRNEKDKRVEIPFIREIFSFLRPSKSFCDSLKAFNVRLIQQMPENRFLPNSSLRFTFLSPPKTLCLKEAVSPFPKKEHLKYGLSPPEIRISPYFFLHGHTICIKMNPKKSARRSPWEKIYYLNRSAGKG